ncbi:hypothetical protein [Williamsoniiplasma lucivorax]|uniref:Uncharacterized protein n=1 Tax=Williamsoniiplasma lucivorax TaxID=209274 RepID=A0A2S5RCW6_9MOLU|nr:hypothetical protein [Williamsoniiplasma lucivorax]PPE05179.1 hypothetical protein ELUCI_v1c07150 [Williamsoniiplasma lucivorax]
MKLETLFLIILATFWLATLIVVGFLAWLYQQKHKPLIAVRKKYFQEFQTLKKHFDLKQLPPIALNWELPIGEKLLFVANKIPIKTRSKKPKQFEKLAKEGSQLGMIESYYDDDEFLPLKAAYKLNLKDHFQTTNGDIFVSNKRIIIQWENQSNLEIALADCLQAYISMIPHEKTLIAGVILHTKKSVYELLLIDSIIVLIINSLLKRGYDV